MSVPGSEQTLNAPELDVGFHLLYELKFEEARTHFQVWQKSHPADPLASASEAASYLFEECNRQGVLTSNFFLDDKRFLGKVPLKPDPTLHAAFFAADQQAQDLALLQLKTNPEDPNALFAMTLSLGMQANYASLIDKHQLESLKKVREADVYAKQLLAVAPDAADAYLGLGMANYFIGSLPGTKKFFLGFAGIHGDKQAASTSFKSPPSMATTYGPLRRFCWLWLPCVRKSQTLRALNSRSSSRSFPRIPFLLVSWPHSTKILPPQVNDRNSSRKLGVPVFGITATPENERSIKLRESGLRCRSGNSPIRL